MALWNDDGARTKSVMVGNNLMLGLGQVRSKSRSIVLSRSSGSNRAIPGSISITMFRPIELKG